MNAWCYVVLLAAAAVHYAAAVTTIQIRTNILVRDTIRFGINASSDNYWDSPMKKVRDTLNFEGVNFRQCHVGNLYEDGFGSKYTDTNLIATYGWAGTLSGATYRILSGPQAGTTGTIVAVARRVIRMWNNSQSNLMAFFVFDRTNALPGHAPINDMGLMLQVTGREQGSVQRQYASYWMTSNCFLNQGDVSPDSWGNTALRMVGAPAEANFRMAATYQSMFDNNGAWQVRLRAKALDGTPRLRLTIDNTSIPAQTVTPGVVWQNFTLPVTMSGISGSTHPTFFFRATGGTLLVDDCEVEKLGFQNPTAFQDDLVALLTNLQVGILRFIQMGGSSVSNDIFAPVRSFSYRSSPWESTNPYQGPGPHSFGMHEYYRLCEYIGIEPWFNIAGTLDPEEMTQYMEYIAGPTNAGMGRIRAALGHPEPWTKTLNRVHVEFGNEAWNSFGPFLGGGFNGPNYWSNLIAVAKSSPYYTNTVLFHTAGQNFSASMANNIIRDASNCDRYAIAPYILHSLSTNDLALNPTDESLFRWLFAYPLMTTYSNGMVGHMAVITNRHVEYSIYEMNHHITGGDAPADPRNKLVASIGGGVSVIHTMLALLKVYGIRAQCFFSLTQAGYNYGSGNIVKLWGGVLNMKKGSERYRPTALALMAVNRVLGGDLVETVHGGDVPRFRAAGYFNGYANPQSVEFPELYSYAFRDGVRRGLILVNLAVVSNQVVALALPEAAVGNTARSWLLTSGNITNNNELENGAPQVALQESQRADFTNGVLLTIPPFSLLALSWQTSAAPQNASILINAGATQTLIPLVTLALSAENPAPLDMQLSESSGFVGAAWTNYLTNTTWTLSPGEGVKTLYAHFRAEGGGISATVSDSITLAPEPGLCVALLWLIKFRDSVRPA